MPEPESKRLFEHLASGEGITSALSVAEVTRAVTRAGIGDEARPRIEAVLAAVDIRQIDVAIIGAAAHLGPAELRTLDAIHLATAIELGGELGELVAYDRRLLEAARRHAIPVASP